MHKTFGHTRIDLVLGDITTLRSDAIVTAANKGLRGGGGVDGAVHRAAGPKLLDACRAIGACDTGSAVITMAYELEERGVLYVIHAVGPIWSGQDESAAHDLLRGAYAKSLELADTHDCKSVAFPSISTGIYRFPIEAAAPIAVGTCAEFLRAGPAKLERVTFSLFDEETLQAFAQALEDL